MSVQIDGPNSKLPEPFKDPKAGIPHRVGRCQQCARFVKLNTLNTCWRVKPGEGYRQIPDDPWNYFARVLCDDCAAGHAHRLPWHAPCTFGEVFARWTLMRARRDAAG